MDGSLGTGDSCSLHAGSSHRDQPIVDHTGDTLVPVTIKKVLSSVGSGSQASTTVSVVGIVLGAVVDATSVTLEITDGTGSLCVKLWDTDASTAAARSLAAQAQ